MAKKKNYNTSLIKTTLSYSTNEIAELFNIHKRTVQLWYDEGLPRIDDRKPYLVLGEILKEFIKDRQHKRKKQCKPDELYCCKCREPRQSLNNFVNIRFLNEKRLLIMGKCCQCNTKLNRVSSTDKLDEIGKIFEIQTILNQDLIGFNSSIVNTDKKGVNLT
ncbi:MAG: helix-turn-helix domain-containing protein [Candidatus Brocadiia bacterium]